jgi:hypothetical protein
MRVVILAAAALVAVAFAPTRLTGALAVNARDQNQDFGIFYRGVHCLFGEGCDPYAVLEGSAPDLAPPHAHLLIAPVAWLERQQAYEIWLLVSVLVVVAVVVRAARELSISLSPAAWALVAALAASSGMMMSLVTSGQIYAVLAWPVTAAWVAWRRGDFARAACWLALGASMKVLLALPLLWFVMRGHWRAALVMAGTMAAVFAGGVGLFGAESYAAWLEMLARSPVAGHFRDGSIMAMLTRTFGDSSSFAPVVDAPWLIRPLWALLTGGVVALALLRPAGPDRTVLGLLAAATLAAPIGWIYSAWWFLGPAGGVWLAGAGYARWLLTASAIVLWLPDTAPLWGQPNPWLTPTVGSFCCWVWFCFWGAPLVPVSRR